MNTKKLSLIVLSVLMALVLSAFVACTGEKPDEGGYSAGAEVGSYYCVVDGAEATLSISEDGSATLVLGGETLNGSCQKDEANPNKIAIAFGESVDLVAEALYANNAITFLFRTKEYRFLRDVNYTVMFDTKGGSNIAPLSIRNGKTAAKPVDPVLEGKVFLGWYKDEACTEAYQFGAEAVTRDITLYALYGDAEEGEFSVSYDLNYAGQEVTTQKTVKGVAELPATPVRDGYEFLGWYVSAYEDADKLTYKYDGQVLYENTTLYAVWKQKSVDFIAVSVIGNQITWNSIGAGTYNVYIYDGENEVVETMSVSGTSCEYDFASCEAGDYRVEVTQRGKTGVSYYKNKALAKISLFNIVNGTALTFNAVPNATEYRITIDCGNPYHKHTLLSNGTSTTYNFANCDMQKGGIKFTVTAVADGYVSSVSETFVFEQGLDKVENLKVNADGTVTWDAVENATSYAVTVKTADGEKVYYLGNNSFSVVDYGVGEMNIGVVAVADKYYSQEATTLSYNKSTIAAPTNVRINETTLVWDAVEGATYTVKISGKEYSAKTNSLELKESYFSGNDYSVSVMATKGGVSSLYSTPVDISKASKLTDDMLTYENGKVYWPNIFGATKYRVSVNGTPKIVNADEHSYALDFIASGEYTVSVAAIGNNIDSSAATINVSVYSVSFESDEGTTVPVMYVAKGDQIVLPESIKGGYDFVGWYNTLGGANTNGKEYHNGQFNYSTDLTMYASWTPKAYTVTLNWKDGDQKLSTTQQVYYTEDYKLQVPQIEANGYAFSGWYMGSIRYTDYKGTSLFAYDRISDVSLEAEFVKVLEFELDKNGESYSVKKNDNTNTFTEITIPRFYDGKPVSTINGSAFASCSNLVTINIPDTIEYIFIGVEGMDAVGSAFASCSALKAINIYETDAAEGEKGNFWSVDGVLYYNNTVTNAIELYAYPKARTGDLVIADGVETIAQYSLKGAKFNSVTIPTSVTSIEKNAFASNSNLTKIEFLEVEEGVETSALTIADEAFYSLSNLLEVTLTDRIGELNLNMFRSCSKLASVNFAKEDGKYYSVDGVVYTKDEQNAVTLVYYPQGRGGDYVVPNGVTKIGDYAFTRRFANTSETSTAKYTYSGNTKLTSITIPAEVSYIGEGAFRGASGVEKVIFRNNEARTLEIGKGAFYGLSDKEFTKVTLPEQLVSLGEYAFGGCTNLFSVTLNSINCKNFANGAFASDTETTSLVVVSYYVTNLYIGAKTSALEIAGVFGLKLEKVVVDPENVNFKVVDDVVYDYDVTSALFVPVEKSGEYVTPDTVTTIGANVFANRKNITKVTIGKNVTTIGESAFNGCSAITEVVFETGREKDLTIGEGAFRSCSNLTSVEIPETTVSMGTEVFANCSKLESVKLPASLTDIAYSYDKTLKKDIFNMFGTASSKLREIIVAEGNTKYASADGVLYQKDEDGKLVTLLYCPRAKEGVIDVPKTVTLINDRAFYYSNAEKLTFSNGIEENAKLVFGAEVFNGSKLTVIELPKGLTEISDKMFYSCTTLEEIAIPSTVTKIGKEAFSGCQAISEIIIPNSVESIGTQAFYNCKALKTITFEEGNDEKNEDGTYSHPLVFEDGTTSSSSGSSEYISYKGIFYNTAVEELDLPLRTTKIGNYFIGCYIDYHYTTSSNYNQTLKKVRIPATIEYMGQYAFYYCQALETVEFYGDGVSKLEDGPDMLSYPSMLRPAFHYTFAYCDSLKSINLPESASENGYTLYYTFSLSYNTKTSQLTEIEIPASVVSMESAFSNNAGLTKVTFRANSKLETLEQSFSGCSSLETVELPDGLQKIGDNAFNGLKAFKTITIPKTVKVIGYNAFNGATALEEVKFATYTEGENAGKCDLAYIYYQAFAGTALKTFAFPESTVESIDLGDNEKGTVTDAAKGRLFLNCTYLTEVILSNSVTKIDYVFKGAPALEKITIPETNKNFKSIEGEPYIYNGDGTAILFVFGTLPTGEFKIKDGVTEISAYAFEGQNTITKLWIPHSVEKIDTGAFANCLSLTEVTFEHTAEHPASLKGDELGEEIFKGCVKLATVSLPGNDNMTVIAKSMFEGTALTEIKIPKSVKDIEEKAFNNCSHLSQVVFEENSKLETLQNYAFNGASFEEISLPANLQVIKPNVFNNNKNLKHVTFLKDENGNTSLTQIYGSAFGNSTEAQAATSLESIIIPKSVETITGSAFYNCIGLKSVIFEEGSECTTIGSSAFKNTGITEFVFPDGVTTIDASVLAGCENLTTVVISENSKANKIAGSVIADSPLVTSFYVPAGVKTISAKAFSNATGLVSVTFAPGVTLGSGTSNFGTNIFENCTSLETVKLPEGPKTLAAQTFLNCTSLKSVTLPSTITEIGAYAFLNCSSLESITIPAAVTKFGNYLFSGCTSLTEVKFEEGFAGLQLGTYMFADYAGTSAPKYPAEACTALKTIEIPASVWALGNYMFRNCTGLETVTFATGSELSALGSNTFYNSGIKEIVVPKGVTSLGTYSINTTKQTITHTCAATTTVNLFYGCENLTKVEFLGNVTKIGGYAFYGCTSLEMDIPAKTTLIGKFAFANTGATTYSIPSTLSTLGDGAFAYNKKLTGFTVSGTKFQVDEATGALIQKSGKKIMCVPAGAEIENGAVTIPSGCVINAYAFAGCDNVKTITLPDNTTTIPNYAFADATGLTSFIVPAGVTKIGTSYSLGYVFDGCTALKEVTFLGNVTLIGGYVFRNCTSLESINLPESVSTIGYGAFAGSGIKEFTFDEGIEYKGTSSSYSIFKDSALEKVTINIDGGQYLVYGASNLTEIIFGEDVTTISKYMFKECTSLETVKIPANIKTILDYAFQGCTALKTVVFETKVDEATDKTIGIESIGAYAFKGCTALDTITIPETVKSIGNYAFSESGIKNVTIPATVETLGTYIFSKCESLSQVTLAEGMTVLSNYMFNGCTALKTIYLPETLTFLGSSTFMASGLESIEIPASVKYLGTADGVEPTYSTTCNLFKDCVSLKKVVLPEGLVAIGGGAFRGCTALEEIVIPDSVTSISGYVFQDCTALKTVKMSKNLQSMGYSVFANCTSIEKIVFHNPITERVESSIFSGWTEEQTICFEFSSNDSAGWNEKWNNSCRAQIVWDYKGE